MTTHPLPAADLEHALSLFDPALWHALRGRRLFITGGTGFVGTWLLATLAEADRRWQLGFDATVLSRDPAAFAARHPDLAGARGVRLLQGDVRSFAAPPGRFDTLIHAATDVAAQNKPLDTFDTCVTGTRRVLDFAVQAGVADLLLVSSGAVYGAQPAALERLPESAPGAPDCGLPATAYGQGKRAAEWLVNAYAAEHGFRARTARCFAFVGPHLPLDRHFAVGNFMRAAMARQPIVIQGDGTPCRSYLHAADMAGWLWKILFSGTPGAAYNVGGSEAVSISELAHRVKRAAGSDAPVTVATPATPATSGTPGGAVQRYVPDTGKAWRELGLGGASLGLDEAIRRSIAWCVEAEAAARR